MNPLSLTAPTAAYIAALFRAVSASPTARHGARTWASRYQPLDGEDPQACSPVQWCVRLTT